MEHLAPVVFVLVFLAIIALPVWLVVKVIRRNRAARNPATSNDLSQLAVRRSWRYIARDDDLVRQFEHYPLRASQPAPDLISGTYRGRQFACFQCVVPYRSSGFDAPMEINYQRVFALSLSVPMPRVRITGARRSPRWMRTYTVGDDAFDRAFMVGTSDKLFASRLLGEPVRQWLLDRPPPGSLQFGGTHLITWRKDRGDFEASMVDPTLEYLNDLLIRVEAVLEH